jgi:serine/threonine-protein kinase
MRTLPTELDARRELAREFRIERLLEQASGPITYLARDRDDRALVVKAAPLCQLGAPADRLLAALEAAARLDHPHIIPARDCGVTESFLWYAAGYVEGRSLESVLETAGPMELAACLRVLEQVASALDYAHRRGVTHGGLAPPCILVDANEWVLVGDFGTGGLLDPAPADAPAAADGHRADQHALAVLARRCLTGAPAGDRPAAPPPGGNVPLHVSQALRRALSVRPPDRFPGVLDFVAALAGGNTRSEAPPVWFGSTPRRGPGSPVVIADSDDDPAAAPVVGRRAAVAGAVIGLVAVAAWLGITALPAAPASRPTGPPVLAAPPPEPSAHAAPPIASRDTLAALPRAPSPAPRPAAPRQPPIRRPAPVAPAPRSVAPVPAEPGYLSVNAIPWGSVYLDGRPIGNTPQLDVTVPPGTHRLRVERDGFRPYERAIEVAPGQRLRITDIALVER